MDYYQPKGPNLRFAVRQLADWMWRMERQRKFTQTQLELSRFDPKSPTFDDVWGFTMVLRYLSSEPEKDFNDQARKYLRRDKREYLSEKFPRMNYQSTAEGAKAVMREVISLSTPAERPLEVPELGYTAEAVAQAMHQWQTEKQVSGCMVYDQAIFEHEDKETERLNALIIKQTRFCNELKLAEEAEEARKEIALVSTGNRDK